MTVVVISIAWGAIAGGVVLRSERRVATAARVRSLHPPAASRAGRGILPPVRRLVRTVANAMSRTALGSAAASVWKSAGKSRARFTGTRALQCEFPLLVDLVAVAVGAGFTPLLALEAVRPWAPGASRQWLDDILDRVRLGNGFAAALDDAGGREPTLAPLTAVLASAAVHGAPMSGALERVARESRAEVRRRAETAARAVPVRLLFPLVLLVLPAFALLTVVPALVSGLSGL